MHACVRACVRARANVRAYVRAHRHVCVRVQTAEPPSMRKQEVSLFHSRPSFYAWRVHAQMEKQRALEAERLSKRPKRAQREEYCNGNCKPDKHLGSDSDDSERCER